LGVRFPTAVFFASSASDVEADEDEETELEDTEQDTEDEEEPDSDNASETRTAWVTSWAGTTANYSIDAMFLFLYSTYDLHSTVLQTSKRSTLDHSGPPRLVEVNCRAS
jgi:hypothetical protein